MNEISLITNEIHKSTPPPSSRAIENFILLDNLDFGQPIKSIMYNQPPSSTPLLPLTEANNNNQGSNSIISSVVDNKDSSASLSMVSSDLNESSSALYQTLESPQDLIERSKLELDITESLLDKLLIGDEDIFDLKLDSVKMKPAREMTPSELSRRLSDLQQTDNVRQSSIDTERDAVDTLDMDSETATLASSKTTLAESCPEQTAEKNTNNEGKDQETAEPSKVSNESVVEKNSPVELESQEEATLMLTEEEKTLSQDKSALSIIEIVPSFKHDSTTAAIAEPSSDNIIQSISLSNPSESDVIDEDVYVTVVVRIDMHSLFLFFNAIAMMNLTYKCSSS